MQEKQRGRWMERSRKSGKGRGEAGGGFLFNSLTFNLYFKYIFACFFGKGTNSCTQLLLQTKEDIMKLLYFLNYGTATKMYFNPSLVLKISWLSASLSEVVPQSAITLCSLYLITNENVFFVSLLVLQPAWLVILLFALAGIQDRDSSSLKYLTNRFTSTSPSSASD